MGPICQLQRYSVICHIQKNDGFNTNLDRQVLRGVKVMDEVSDPYKHPNTLEWFLFIYYSLLPDRNPFRQ